MLIKKEVKSEQNFGYLVQSVGSRQYLLNAEVARSERILSHFKLAAVIKSTAFDTVDHKILLKRLHILFRLSGNF